MDMEDERKPVGKLIEYDINKILGYHSSKYRKKIERKNKSRLFIKGYTK